MAFPNFSGMQWWHRNSINTSWAETIRWEWSDCWTVKRTQAVSSFLRQRHDLFCISRVRFSSEPLLVTFEWFLEWSQDFCVRRKRIEVLLTFPSLFLLFFSWWKSSRSALLHSPWGSIKFRLTVSLRNPQNIKNVHMQARTKDTKQWHDLLEGMQKTSSEDRFWGVIFG